MIIEPEDGQVPSVKKAKSRELLGRLKPAKSNCTLGYNDHLLPTESPECQVIFLRAQGCEERRKWWDGLWEATDRHFQSNEIRLRIEAKQELGVSNLISKDVE